MSKPTKPIPRFKTEAEERAFWESHDSSAYVDWSKARHAALPKLKPATQTISLRLPQHLLDAIKAAVRDSIKTDDHPVGRILIEELERKVAAAA